MVVILLIALIAIAIFVMYIKSKEVKTKPAKPEVKQSAPLAPINATLTAANTTDLFRNPAEIANKKLEEELLTKILEAYPHLQIGNKMTGPVGMTIDGRAPTKEEMDAYWEDSFSNNLKTIEAVSFRLQIPFSIESLKGQQRFIDAKFIHPYLVVAPARVHFEIGDTIDWVNPFTFETEPKIVDEEYFKLCNTAIFRCGFSN